MFTHRKSFRPAYGRLDSLTSLFPRATILGLTATATKQAKSQIIKALGLIEPAVIEVNPDRPNIYFSSATRPDRGEDKLVSVLEPLLRELQVKRLESPLTVVFGNLETISSCFAYFSQKMGKEQYEPKGSAPVAQNRLFTQFHAQYPVQERETIVEDLTSGKSKLRIVFATVAFGIGLDLGHIRRVIHIGIPYSIEEYFQEAGRAGRDGLPAEAHIYYNAYDISKARKNMSESMREYVKTPKCKREMILDYFGCKPSPRTGHDHECCDYHKKQCKCDDCVLFSMACSLDLSSPDETPTEAQGELQLNQITTEQKAGLYEELVNFRLSLPGTGRTCVGSTSLSTGISIQLISDIVENAATLTSVQEIEGKLPIFSHENAVAIFDIVKKYTEV